jgi:hypothetical protein
LIEHNISKFQQAFWKENLYTNYCQLHLIAGEPQDVQLFYATEVMPVKASSEIIFDFIQENKQPKTLKRFYKNSIDAHKAQTFQTLKKTKTVFKR